MPSLIPAAVLSISPLLAVASEETMILKALFVSPMSLLVLLAIIGMIYTAIRWFKTGQRSLDLLTGGLDVVRQLGAKLPDNHPVRKRLESAPVVEISLEELSKLMAHDRAAQAVKGLLVLQRRVSWIERFAQFSVHLGILGTVVALVTSDPTDMGSFRQQLPTALGTTFWGLAGTLILSTIAGWVDDELERTSQLVRRALLDSFDDVLEGDDEHDEYEEHDDEEDEYADDDDDEYTDNEEEDEDADKEEDLGLLIDAHTSTEKS